MKTQKSLAMAMTAALVLPALFGTSAFADSRHQKKTKKHEAVYSRSDRNDRDDDDRGDRYQQRSQPYRNGTRAIPTRRSVSMDGRVRTVRRVNGGYQLQLDRSNYTYYVPQAVVVSRGRNAAPIRALRVGLPLRLIGLLGQSGLVQVSSAQWLGDNWSANSNYGNSRYDQYGRYTVTGVVDRVDYGRGTVVLREQQTGRWLTAYMGRYDNRGVDLNDLRRGDVVRLSGDWSNNDTFQVARIDAVQSPRIW